MKMLTSAAQWQAAKEKVCGFIVIHMLSAVEEELLSAIVFIMR